MYNLPDLTLLSMCVCIYIYIYIYIYALKLDVERYIVKLGLLEYTYHHSIIIIVHMLSHDLKTIFTQLLWHELVVTQGKIF